MTTQPKIKFPRHSPRHGEDWIIDPAFIRRVMHSIAPDHPDDFTPTPAQVETTLLAIEVIPSNLYTSTSASKPWVGLTKEEIAEIAATPAAIPGSYVHSFACAIEAKLKEKNT